MMKTLRLTLLLLLLASQTLVQAAGQPPEATANLLREALFNAQLSLATKPATALHDLSTAENSYDAEFAGVIQPVAPAIEERVRAGFDSAKQALVQGDSPAFVAARAQVWTSIMAGSYAVVEDALSRGDGSTAQEWLPVREFRATTRFSRPNTDATLAVEGFVKGTVTQSDAQLAVRTDLFDTYQALLIETFHDLTTADASGFSIRRAELAALAQGYFRILAPAYEQQRGAGALRTMEADFTELARQALKGGDLTPTLMRIEAALQTFRAAPLSPEERSHRASQMLRYLDLVSVEYGRGVAGDQVIHNFEIQEAITFHTGAFAAFSDIESLLDARDHEKTAQSKGLFEGIEKQLDQASKGFTVASPASIKSQVDTLSGSLKTILPDEWLKVAGNQGDFDVIASLLDQMEAAVAGHDYSAAESARLEAYAIMETGPEARLMAFAPQLKLEMEDLFWNGQGRYKGLAYLIKNQAPLTEIQTTRTHLDTSLDQARILVGAKTAPLSIAVNAGLIMFREGLEAVIILASLMSSMRREDEHQYRKPMWLGTAAAVIATAITWLLAHDALKSLVRYGEKLEAIVSLFAIGVLLVIMNWFFHKLYWTEWIASFHARKRRIVSGETGLWLGLITLGFTSVYREGFETVLFLQALVLESGVAVVMSGVAAALLAVVLVGFITFRLQVKLPYKKMLVFTGMLIGAVLLQMVGNTTHVLQIIGWLPIHAIAGLPLPYWIGTWFGVYATWEGVGLQVLAGAFVIGSYYLAEGMKKTRYQKASNAAAKPPLIRYRLRLQTLTQRWHRFHQPRSSD
jgi:high-affinity iron transporter